MVVHVCGSGCQHLARSDKLVGEIHGVMVNDANKGYSLRSYILRTVGNGAAHFTNSISSRNSLKQVMAIR